MRLPRPTLAQALVAGWVLAAAACAGAGFLVVVTGAGDRLGGGLMALGLAGLAGGLGVGSRLIESGAGAVEDRDAPFDRGDPGDEPMPLSPARRRLLLGGGAAATLVAVTGIRVLGPDPERLRGTAWRAGARLVTTEGRPVHVGDLRPGATLTVLPEGASAAFEAETILVRLEPGQTLRPPGRAEWSAEGYVAYSRLCTHMGCPVGLYEQRTNTLLCPCHQAGFAVLEGARPLFGPAWRPLPQLPLTVDADGHLVAGGDFDDVTGPGFWGRPS